MVMSADHPDLTFTLSLLQSEPTFHQPVQQWSFISDFAVSLHSDLNLGQQRERQFLTYFLCGCQHYKISKHQFIWMQSRIFIT